MSRRGSDIIQIAARAWAESHLAALPPVPNASSAKSAQKILPGGLLSAFA